jgi:hypothetical protein
MFILILHTNTRVHLHTYTYAYTYTRPGKVMAFGDDDEAVAQAAPQQSVARRDTRTFSPGPLVSTPTASSNRCVCVCVCESIVTKPTANSNKMRVCVCVYVLFCTDATLHTLPTRLHTYTQCPQTHQTQPHTQHPHHSHGLACRNNALSNGACQCANAHGCSCTHISMCAYSCLSIHIHYCSCVCAGSHARSGREERDSRQRQEESGAHVTRAAAGYASVKKECVCRSVCVCVCGL